MTDLPYIQAGLFNAGAPDAADPLPMANFRNVEVQPVTFGEDATTAHLRGDDVKPDAWSVYLRDRDGVATCVADLKTEAGADALAAAIVAEYGPGIVGMRNTLRSYVSQSDIVETAMSLWEACIDAHNALSGNDPDLAADHWSRALAVLLEEQGWSEMRCCILGLSHACHVEWVRACELEDYQDSFDWEWCPAWLAKLEWWEDGEACAPKLRTAAVAAPEPISPTEVGADTFADMLETLVRAVRHPDNASGNDDRASDADERVQMALRNASALLARVGVEA